MGHKLSKESAIGERNAPRHPYSPTKKRFRSPPLTRLIHEAAPSFSLNKLPWRVLFEGSMTLCAMIVVVLVHHLQPFREYLALLLSPTVDERVLPHYKGSLSGGHRRSPHLPLARLDLHVQNIEHQQPEQCPRTRALHQYHRRQCHVDRSEKRKSQKDSFGDRPKQLCLASWETSTSKSAT